MNRIMQVLDPTQTGKEAQILEAGLHQRVIGQDNAVAQIVNIYQMYMTGMAAPGRPIGSFLFLGPTGSGKTRMVEATAETLLGSPRAVIKIDCAEFQHSHEIAKLIGSPPGYLGHRETHPLLSQEVLNQFHTEKIKLSFVLFDEIEKASDSLWNLLLGILDKATLTLGDNRRVDFSRAMIFLTSNLGASRMVAKTALGFASAFANELIERKAEQVARVEKIGMAAARSRFTPEFINRLDKICGFSPLDDNALSRILEVELSAVQQRIMNTASGALFSFRCDHTAKQLLLREGSSQEYGARHLKRAIERLLVHPLSNLIATGQVRTGDLVGVSCPTGEPPLQFTKEAEGLSAYQLATH